MRIHSLISAVGIAGSLIAMPSAMAAELVPYAPPVSQTSSAQKAVVVVSESVYADFAAQARKMNGQQRNDLRATFETNRNNAQQSGDISRAIYYQRLVDILSATT